MAPNNAREHDENVVPKHHQTGRQAVIEQASGTNTQRRRHQKKKVFIVRIIIGFHFEGEFLFFVLYLSFHFIIEPTNTHDYRKKKKKYSGSNSSNTMCSTIAEKWECVCVDCWRYERTEFAMCIIHIYSIHTWRLKGAFNRICSTTTMTRHTVRV